jgi:hypothetical protein
MRDSRVKPLGLRHRIDELVIRAGDDRHRHAEFLVLTPERSSAWNQMNVTANIPSGAAFVMSFDMAHSVRLLRRRHATVAPCETATLRASPELDPSDRDITKAGASELTDDLRRDASVAGAAERKPTSR